MNRGDIWFINLGGKIGVRPVLVLTRQGVIPFLNKVTVAEITTQGKGYPTEVEIGTKGNLPEESFVQLDNIHTVSKDKLFKYMGTLDSETMRLVSRKIILALELEDAL
jgi:mRNA-degrading endonuclease toxin of MazEF toxin-antitoxin module